MYYYSADFNINAAIGQIYTQINRIGFSHDKSGLKESFFFQKFKIGRILKNLLFTFIFLRSFTDEFIFYLIKLSDRTEHRHYGVINYKRQNYAYQNYESYF